MSLANILKESTKEAHAIAESKPFQQAMLSGDIELKLLGKYFVQLHAIHEAIEKHFETHSQVAEILAWNESRCHSRNLESDLRALNMWGDFEILDITQDFINEIENEVTKSANSIIAFFYVLEGSMNGNSYIVRSIRSKNMDSNCEFNYFDPYGQEQRNEWMMFRDQLDKVKLESHQEAAMVSCASRMFEVIGLISDQIMTAPVVA